MGVTSLREITVGVRDLNARIAQFETGCGLTLLRNGPLSSIAASRLFDTHIAPKAAVMGRRKMIVEYNGTDTEVSAILANLIHIGIPVVHFSEDMRDLEEVFMRATQGIVS